MRSTDRLVRGMLRTCLLVAVGAATTAHAGGPLIVVPVGNELEPARWHGTVKVYTDQGTLGTLGNAKADQIVRKALREWSTVPTSSFRAVHSGKLGADITAANASTVIGARNGGGIQVIYDSDGSVIADFIGAGYGVLGIASPEFMAGEGSSRIVEGWVIVNGEEDFSAMVPDYVPGDPTSGVVTHEFGHAINLAHSQTNGYYARNRPNPELGMPAGPEQAGPDQCGRVVDAYPGPEHLETMYPLINPYPYSSGYNSPHMATVNVLDDKAALSSIYPAKGYSQHTGTIRGQVVAKDGTSPLTGINVIARRLHAPFDAVSRISGDLTQGLLGPDGTFVMTGLWPGSSYLLYIDEIATGGFSTPKAVLLGPEEYWNAHESGDASRDDACDATPIVLAAGETRELTIAVNGVARAPTFTHLPYVLPSSLSADGSEIAGVYAPSWGPFWRWDRKDDITYIGGFGSGTGAAMSANGRVIGGGVSVTVETEWGPVDQERAALWTRDKGWTDVSKPYAGCGPYHTSVYDLSSDGSRAVGLAFVDCENAYAFEWTRDRGMRTLSKASEERQCSAEVDGTVETWRCEGPSRANAISGRGHLIGGWEEIPEAPAMRVGALWHGREQMLLRDPAGTNAAGGWVGEVTDINSSGSIAVGMNAGADLKDAWKWTPHEGVTSLGRYPGKVCYFDWFGNELCEERETAAFSVSDDGKVITGASRLLAGGVDDGAIWTPRLGWMLLGDFLEKQGVLEASRWLILGSKVSANGKVITGAGLPLAGDYWQGFRLELDQVFVCHGRGRGAQTLQVGFPEAMDAHLAHGDRFGLCKEDAPL